MSTQEEIGRYIKDLLANHVLLAAPAIANPPQYYRFWGETRMQKGWCDDLVRDAGVWQYLHSLGGTQP